MIYDAIVIGSGPSGISCAIYLKRYGYQVLVIGKDGGALSTAHWIENYYGIEGITGKDLWKNGVEQAKKLGITVLMEEVLSLDKNEVFEVTLEKEKYHSKTVFLACGTSRNKWAKGLAYEGRGVSYCVTCDAFLYRKKRAAILGYSKFMAHELDILRNIVPDVTVFTDGHELEFELDEHIKCVKDPIESLIGEERLEAIKTAKEMLPMDVCFVALGSLSGFSMAQHLGIALNKNSIAISADGKTNIEGLYAGGDVVGGLLQVSKAVGDGAVAATAMSSYLKQLK